ncbi:MAG: SdrD B-like domain-containing protein, partial [Betaproteobacteria bacterium]
MSDLSSAVTPPCHATRRRLQSLRSLTAALLMLVAPAIALAADPLIASFSDDPDPVVAGGIVRYQVRVDNNAPDAATNTRLTLDVPAGATFVSASPASANCALQTPTRVVCELGSIAGSGTGPKDITIRWRALGPGPTTIGATATLTADNDVNPSNNTQSEVTTVNTGANLALTKTGAPNPVAGGSNVTYTLTASNAGPNASGAIVLTDNLPPAVAFVSATGSGWSCSHAAGVVTCNRAGPHAVGAAIPAVTVVGQVNAAGGTITNSATVLPAAGGVADPDTADNTATADTIVVPGADIRIAQKTVTSGTPAIAGSNVTFQIQPRNSGPATAVDAVLTDPLPAGWTFVSASGPNWTCGNSGNTVTCTRASFPTSATDNITIVATAPPNGVVAPGGTTYTNTASITSATNDPNPGNNSGSVNVQVRPDGADLRITKTKSPNPVAQGSNVTSIITVTNNGPRTATGPLRVIEVLSGESFVSFSGPGWSCDASGAPVIVCEHPAGGGLNALNELPKLTIVSKAEISGTVTNTACTGSSVPAGVDPLLARPPGEGDPNPTNDCTTQGASSTTVQPDLSISKETRTANGDKVLDTNEDTVTYRLVVRNVSGSAQSASGIRVTDTVPGFISGRSTFGTIAAEAGSPITVTGTTAGAAVTCTQTGGLLQDGQEVAINIPVNRPLQDSNVDFTNTATVFNTAEGDPNPTNNSASDIVRITPIADVEMTGKSVTPNPVRAGEIATYVISFRNNGPSTAAGVVVTDTITFPAGDSGATVTQITSSKAGSTCSIAAGAVLNGASNTFTCNIGSLANGEVQSITLRLRPNFQPGNADRVYTNTASISTTTAESTSGSGAANSKTATLDVSGAQVDLLVNKLDRVGSQVFDPVGYLSTGTFLSYDVRVTNNGPSYATGVQFAETMTPPAGRRVRFVCDVTAFGGSTCNAPSLCSVTNVTSASGTAIPTFTCTVPAGTAATGSAVGDLASGITKSVFLRFEVLDEPAPLGDVYQNSVTVSANEPDNVSANNTAIEQTTVRQRVDLRTSKSASVATPSIMQPFNWVVTVTNGVPGNSLQTDVTDTLPAGVEVTGPITWTKTLPAASGTCSRTGVTVSCALGQLNGTGSAAITIPVRITSFPAGGTLTNTATVDADPIKTGGLDIDTSDNTSTSTVTVVRSSLAGMVFQDRDRSGSNGGVPQAAAAEPRIAGVSIALTGTDAFGNAVSRSAITDASGAYLFDNLAPADATGYTIAQTQPAGFVNGPVAPPASGALAPSAGGTYNGGGLEGNSSYTAITLAANTQGTLYNFPEVRRPSLSGIVYLDLNVNSTFDAASDTRVAGATVRLLNAGTGALVATVTTDGTGAYSFASVDPLIVYTIEQPLPSSPTGLRNGPVNPGLINGAACASGCTAQPNTPVADTDRIASIDLGAGTDGTVFNFGELVLTSISGTVYIDRNRNNVIDAVPTDGRIAGVSVRLVQGADCTAGTVLQSAVTDAVGSYSFTSVTAGAAYLVCETQPVGYADGIVNPGTSATTPSPNVISIAALPTTGSPNNNFGERVGSLSGSVYVDYSPATPANTNNGVRDAGEAGIAGVTVTLTGTDATGAAVNRSAVTDANGDYVFADLLAAGAGGYTVSEGAIPPAAGVFLDGLDTAGTAGGTTAVSDVISGITLAAGVQSTGYLFGELPSAPISGTVYIDRNRNSQMDPVPTDGRLAGVAIRLVQGATCTGTTLASTVTDASGAYLFSANAAGLTYTVCETQPVGYADGGVNLGANASSSAANAITITNLPAAGSPNNNFGERVGSLSGSVYVDYSPATPANTNNGVRDAGEAGIAGVTVTLTGTDATGAAVSRSVVTDANGDYVFADLLAAGAGGYTVSEGAIPPAAGRFLDGKDRAGTAGGSIAVSDVISGIALAAGRQATDYLFGELIGASISGKVFLDRNNNGVQDAAEEVGLANVPIVITGTDDRGTSVSLNLTTGADGTYSAPDLRPGTYTITEPTQPLDTTNGQTIAGSAGGTATPITTLPSAISGIILGVGVSSTGNNFAEIPNNAELRGRVWFDLNNNGLIDGGENGIAGVTLELTGTDVLGRVVNRSVVTDAGGAFVFTELASGTYKLNEPQQPPATRNGITVAGTRGGTATAVTVLPSSISGIVLSDGAKGESYNFGEIPDSPDLRVSKRAVESVFTVGFPANYRISVRNAGLLPTTGVYTVSDRLPPGLVLAARPTGPGWTCDGAVGATRFSCTSTDIIGAGATSASQISVVATVTPQAADASPAINAVMVDGGGEIDAWRPTPGDIDAFNNRPGTLPPCTATIELNACHTSTQVQRAAALSGTVWYDIGSTPRVLDAGDRRLAGWSVELVDTASNSGVGRATTAADGSYRVIDLLPGVALAVRFRDPASGVVFGYPVNGEQGTGSSGVSCDPNAAGTGKPSSCVNQGVSPALAVVLAPGQELVQQSLPVDPSGVVYDSGVRTPVPGSIVTLAPVGACGGWAPATGIVGAGLGGYTINGDRISMTVGTDGFYQFLFGTTAPASCTFGLTVTPPAAYTFQSTAIPPTAGPLVPPGGPGSVFNVQPQATAPSGPVGTATTYYLTMVSGSGGANIVHNHIPLDPALPTGIALTKTGDKATVEVGDTVRYTLTVTVTAGALPRQTTIVDRLPAGVTYVPGTAMVGDKPIADPRGGVGPTLAFDLGPMPAGRQLVLRYRARVGVGAMQGDGINRAQGHACSVPAGCVDGGFNPLPGSVPTNPAAYRIRVTGGVFTTDACVLGKIYVDCNGNHIQDPEELGIPGVRMIMQDGTTLISDSEGKYSICGIPARSAVMKVDPITLPRGSRLTTSSNRNLGDAGSLWLDLKNGELHRADF